MRTFIILGCLGLMLAGAVPARAFNGDGGMGGGFQDQLQDIKRTQLGPALGADQRTVDQLLQVEKKYKLQEDQAKRDFMAAMLKLQQIMQDPTPREPEVRAILDSLDQKRKETENLKQRQWEEQRAMLTPVQQARYLMYLMSIKKEARSLKRAPGGPAILPKGPREVPVTRPTR